MRNPTAAILLVLAATLPSAPDARAQGDCALWTEDMSMFFFVAETWDVEYCLVVGASVDARDDSGMTPLHHAALRSEKPGLVGVLLKAGADPAAQTDRGDTPLHHAASSGHLEAIEALLAAGADPDAQSDLGYAPLHNAAFRGHIEVVGALLDAGADPRVRLYSFTPLRLAEIAGHTEIVAALQPGGRTEPVAALQPSGHTEPVAALQPAESGLGDAVASALREELPAAQSGSGGGRAATAGAPSGTAASGGTGRGIGSKLFSALRKALKDALKRKLRDVLKRELGKALGGSDDAVAAALIGGVLDGEDSNASTSDLLAALSGAEMAGTPVGAATPGGSGDEFGDAVASALRAAKAGTDAGSAGVGDKLISSLRDAVRGSLRRELGDALDGAGDGAADALIGGLLDGKDVDASTAELLVALPGAGGSNTRAVATAPRNVQRSVGAAGSRNAGVSPTPRVPDTPAGAASSGDARGAVGTAGRRDTAPSPGTEFQDCRNCPEMVVVPAGSFRMGCVSGQDCNDSESPLRRVAISRPFALSTHEVTFAQWDACVAAGGCGGHRPDDGGWGRGRGRGARPVINVSWEDAQSFVAWLSEVTGHAYRLPTESEWEYAARAGSQTKYSWGNGIGNNQANCDGCGSRWDGEMTAPVASFGANAFGLRDMHGNVLEWVEDCWNRSYAGAPSNGSAWLSGNCDARVLRGGSWSFPPWSLRSAYRNGNSSGIRVSDLGFRVARTLTP